MNAQAVNSTNPCSRSYCTAYVMLKLNHSRFLLLLTSVVRILALQCFHTALLRMCHSILSLLPLVWESDVAVERAYCRHEEKPQTAAHPPVMISSIMGTEPDAQGQKMSSKHGLFPVSQFFFSTGGARLATNIAKFDPANVSHYMIHT